MAAGRAGSAQIFGRDPQADGEPTDLGCPDCRGVLRLQAQTRPGLRLLRCMVGHSFSNESLVEAKEEQVEEALWMATEAFEELRLIHGALAEDAEARGDGPLARSCRRRAERAADHAAALRRIIATDRPADLEAGDGGGP